MLIICKQCFKKYNFQFNLNFKYILHVIVYLNTYTKKKIYILSTSIEHEEINSNTTFTFTTAFSS